MSWKPFPHQETMTTYRDSKMTLEEEWYQEMTVGQRWVIENEGVLSILTARSLKLGAPAPLHCGWNGFYADTIEPEAVRKAVLDAVPDLKLAGRYIDFDNKDRQDGFDFWYFHKSGAIHVLLHDKSGDVEYIGNDIEIAKKLNAIVDPMLISLPPAGTVYMMTSTENGPEFHSVGDGGRELERGNYDPQVLEGYDRIKLELITPDPRGRLTILNGPAGTGKTYLIRGLLQEVKDAVFVVVQPHFLPSLAEPAALTALTKLRRDHEGEPIILVIEDADECLASREDTNMSAVSAVLNIGDGLMGSVLDVRIVATTNAEHQNFDPAIKRPGRLSTSMTVDKVSVEKANEIYKRLTGKDAVTFPSTEDPLKPEPMISSPVTVAEVYQLAYDAGWKPMPSKKKKSVGFGTNYPQ